MNRAVDKKELIKYNKRMDNKKRLGEISEGRYKVMIGVTKETFEKMLEILESANKEMHKRGGMPSRLSVLDKLVVMLGYYHDYRTMKNIAFDYDVSKSRICDAISWVEETLIKDGTFALPSKREVLKSNNKISVAIIDVTECEIERPKKNKNNTILERKKGTL